MTSIRASKVPLSILCPRSMEDGLIAIDSDNQEARLGTAAHAGVAQYTLTGAHDPASSLAAQYGVDDAEELEKMMVYARMAWDSLSPQFPSPIVEQSLSINLGDLELTGHPDLVQVGEDWVAVADYKTGRRHRDYYLQLLAYALLLTETHKKPKWSVTLVWLRDGVMDTRSGGPAELDEFKQQLTWAWKTRNKAPFRINDNCGFCPRFHDCPARHALVRQTTRDLGTAAIDFTALEPHFKDFYSGLKCVEKACEDFRALLRAHLEQVGQYGGYELREIERRHLDPLKAWPVLSARLDETAIAGAMKISISQIEKAVMDAAPKGQKKGAKEELNAELDAAGAIERRVERRMSEVKETR